MTLGGSDALMPESSALDSFLFDYVNGQSHIPEQEIQ